MNKIITVFLLLLSYTSYSQIEEGQKFCDETKDASYFPVSKSLNKKIRWGNTFYIEATEGTQVIDGKMYFEFKQEWEDKNVALLYLREENGVVYQYEKEYKAETIRYDKNFKKGDSWKGADGKSKYQIISYNGELKTPYCEYKNLLVIEATVDYGHFKFYYRRGFGYIGATIDGKLNSCMTPE